MHPEQNHHRAPAEVHFLAPQAHSPELAEPTATLVAAPPKDPDKLDRAARTWDEQQLHELANGFQFYPPEVLAITQDSAYRDEVSRVNGDPHELENTIMWYIVKNRLEDQGIEVDQAA